jgi:hypothetical protein
MTFADRAIKYFTRLSPPKNPTVEISIINPYKSNTVKKVVKDFFRKYYADTKERIFVIGINPGRFGGGLTGISFTDPVALREKCRIENDLGTRKELSSIFIYKVIDRFGGVDKFFSEIFLTALYPYAIIKDGKNYNYYDEKKLFISLKQDIVDSVSAQIDFGAVRRKAIVLGKKNAEYFLPINEKCRLFDKIIVLDHPRYIMQYKLKKIGTYIHKYLEALD